MNSKHQFWRKHLSGARDYSGSVEAYCRINGIKSSVFYYWKKKLETKSAGSKLISPQFIPVEVIKERHCNLPNAQWLAEFIICLNGGSR